MAQPSRARRVLKWTGAVLSLLIIGAWATTEWRSTHFVFAKGMYIWLRCGAVVAGQDDFGLRTGLPPEPNALVFGFPNITWRALLIPNDPSTAYSVIYVPLWLLLTITAIPTAWLWHRDRRRIRPGCCLRCGYDLTGNTSGVCPECGDKVHPAAVLADSECGEKKAMANSE